MFRPEGYFNIIDFDNICKVANVIPDRGVRDRLALFHCHNWRDMDSRARQLVYDAVLSSLSMHGFVLEFMEPKAVEVHTKPKGLFARLLPSGD